MQLHRHVLVATILGLLLAPFPTDRLQAADTVSSTLPVWPVPAYASRKKNPIPASSAAIDAGSKLFVISCAPCHGAQGRGDGPAAAALNPRPANLSLPAMWQNTDGDLFYKLTTGKTPMPAFDVLSETDRWDLVNFVRTLAPKPHATVVGAASVPTPVTAQNAVKVATTPAATPAIPENAEKRKGPVSREEYEQLQQQLKELQVQLQQLRATVGTPAQAATTNAETIETQIEQVDKAQAEAQEESDRSMAQLDTDLSKVARQAKSAIPGTSKMFIGGYAAATFTSPSSGYGPSQPPEETAGPPRDSQKSFQANFNPIFLWRLSDRMYYVGEIELETDVNTRSVNANLETSYLGYELNDYVNLDAGVFLDPANYYVERQHMAWVNKLPDRPLAVYDGLMPESEVGVEARGGVPLGPFKGEYALFGAMAPQLVTTGDDVAVGTLDSENFGGHTHIAAGGHVGFFPIPQLELGYGFQVFDADPVDGNGASLGSGVGTFLQSADLNFVDDTPAIKGRAEFRAQWMWSHIDSYNYTALDPNPMYNNDRDGGYVQLSYRPTRVANNVISHVEPVVRYDVINELHTPAGLDERRFTVGLNYWLGPSMVVKAAYAIDQQDGWADSPYGAKAQNGDAFMMQLAYGF